MNDLFYESTLLPPCNKVDDSLLCYSCSKKTRKQGVRTKLLRDCLSSTYLQLVTSRRYHTSCYTSRLASSTLLKDDKWK